MGFRKGNTVVEITVSVAIATLVSIIGIDLYTQNISTVAETTNIVKTDNVELTKQNTYENEKFILDKALNSTTFQASLNNQIITTTAGQGTLREEVIQSYKNLIVEENSENTSEETKDPMDFSKDSRHAILTGYLVYLYIYSDDYYKSVAIAVPFKNDTYFIEFIGDSAIQYKIDNVTFDDIIHNKSAENKYWDEEFSNPFTQQSYTSFFAKNKQNINLDIYENTEIETKMGINEILSHIKDEYNDKSFATFTELNEVKIIAVSNLAKKIDRT